MTYSWRRNRERFCGYLATSIAAARTKSDSPLNPLRFAVICSNAFSSAVNRTLTCMVRLASVGSKIWQEMTSKKLGVESTFQPRGRPRRYK
jgi:hypothetical protein